MQTQYVDKYETELRIAKKKAVRIEGPMEICVPYLRYVGAEKIGESITHYYFAASTGTYYYESEFAKQMRIRNRQRRLQRYVKK